MEHERNLKAMAGQLTQRRPVWRIIELTAFAAILIGTVAVLVTWWQ